MRGPLPLVGLPLSGLAMGGLLLCAALCWPLAATAEATASSSGTQSWTSLSPAQRAALAPLERDWSQLDASRQQKWIEIAGRLPRMAPDERERMQDRMRSWAARTPQERGQARMTYQQIRQLTPEEREARWQAYQALPPEQKRQLAERAPRTPSKPAAAQAGTKSNVVRAADGGNTRPAAPTLLQAAPGATTTLVTRPPNPPQHQQAGMPKIAATPGFVDTTTLLPRRAQASASKPSAGASAPLQRP